MKCFSILLPLNKFYECNATAKKYHKNELSALCNCTENNSEKQNSAQKSQIKLKHFIVWTRLKQNQNPID